MSELPAGWVETTLGEVVEICMGQSPPGSSTNTDGNGIKLVGGAADIKGDVIAASKFTTEPTKVCAENDLIVCVRATIGRSAYADQPYCLGRGVAGLRPSIESDFVRYLIELDYNRLNEAGTGTTFRQIDKKTISEWPIPLPPLAEQRRILEKLDALSAQSRAAAAALTRIETLITRYKAAVLGAAFAAEYNYVAFEDVIEEGPSNGWSPAEGTGPNQTTSLKLSATTSGRFVFNDATTKTIPEAPAEGSKYWLQVGDVLIQRANSLEYVGTAVEVDHLPEASIYPDLMMRVRINDPVLRKLIVFYLNSAPAKAFFRDNATGTAGNMPKISGRTLKQLPVPLPPLEEQAEIVARIEAAFSQIETLSRAAAAARVRLSALDRAILARAFKGKLVPQNPNDEPASELLKRVKCKQN